jgi:hypothetical protein
MVVDCRLVSSKRRRAEIKVSLSQVCFSSRVSRETRCTRTTLRKAYACAELVTNGTMRLNPLAGRTKKLGVRRQTLEIQMQKIKREKPVISYALHQIGDGRTGEVTLVRQPSFLFKAKELPQSRSL